MADTSTRKATRAGERAALEAGRGGTQKARPLFEPAIVRKAIVESFAKLDPRHQIRNPAMLVVEIGSLLTTSLFVFSLAARGEESAGFVGSIAACLWFTVLVANFAEAMAEGRGKAQADTLRKARKDIQAVKLSEPSRDSARTEVSAS